MTRKIGRTEDVRGRTEDVRRMIGIGIVLGLGMILLGCGGKSTGPKTYEDGRVFVENRTEYELEVTFLNDALEMVKTVVAANAQKVEVSQGMLTGGKKYTFKVEAHSLNFTSNAQVELKINGPVTIQILQVPVYGSYGGQIKYSITGG